MDVSVIVVNYKTADLISNLIKSIKEKTDFLEYEIIVVDNSNSDKEQESLNSLLNDGVQVLKPFKNLGFGGANNYGASFSSGKYLFFLNPDTLLVNNAIFELFNFLESNNNAGIAGSNLFTSSMGPNHSFFLKEKNIRNEKNECNILHSVLRAINHKRNDFNYSSEPLRIYGYVCGASLMIRKSDFQELGGFDSDIFMYAEESLLCKKMINDLKLSVYNVPSSKIVHFEGGSFGSGFTESRANNYVDGNYIYYKKVFGKETAFKYLKSMERINHTKMIVSRFFCRKKQATYRNLFFAYHNKMLRLKQTASNN